MACDNEGCDCGGKGIKLDGSGGVGDLARLTIFRTDDVQGEIEETFVFPYVLIHFAVLQVFSSMRQINGYTVKRLPKKTEVQ
jgi:hypothetical protein